MIVLSLSSGHTLDNISSQRSRLRTEEEQTKKKRGQEEADLRSSGKINDENRKRRQHPYPSLCRIQCASKQAAQLTGDTSFVRRHSTHSSSGGRPLVPPPPGAPQEEQEVGCRGIEN